MEKNKSTSQNLQIVDQCNYRLLQRRGLICISMQLRLTGIISFSSILWLPWSPTEHYCYNWRAFPTRRPAYRMLIRRRTFRDRPSLLSSFYDVGKCSGNGIVFLFVLIELFSDRSSIVQLPRWDNYSPVITCRTILSRDVKILWMVISLRKDTAWSVIFYFFFETYRSLRRSLSVIIWR